MEQPRNSFYGTRNSFPEVVKQPAVIDAAPLKELHSPASVTGIPVSDTQALLREFESVYDEVELNNGTLTPPQSPTISQNLLYHADVDVSTTSAPMYITSFSNIIPVQSFSTIPAVPIKIAPVLPYIPILIQEKKPTTLTNLEQMVPATPVPDIAKELADVEELVRTCAEDIGTTTDPWENVNISNNTLGGSVKNHFDRTPPSPSTSSNSSFESSEDGIDDPDWIPVPVQSSECGKVTNRKRSGASKPYGRPGSEDKRQRKKEQNKNAATRYRQKKKAEVEEIQSEEKGLEDKNVELKHKLSDLSREIKYLKGLMRDVFRAKGLIK